MIAKFISLSEHCFVAALLAFSFVHIPFLNILSIAYSAKFSRVLNFANFTKFSTVCENNPTTIYDTRRAVCACAANSQNYFNEIFKNHYSQNLDPRQFSAMRYNMDKLHECCNFIQKWPCMHKQSIPGHFFSPMHYEYESKGSDK